MAEALRDAMRIALRSDPTVLLLGEDIGVPKGFGGGFTVTLGLSEELGRDRVMDTPISENAIVGAAVGATVGLIGGGSRRRETANRMYNAAYQDCMAGRIR